MHCGKTVDTIDSIEMPFGVGSRVGPRTHEFGGRAYWRHLANAVERLCVAAMTGSATMGGDAACSQITLGNLLLLLFSPPGLLAGQAMLCTATVF